MLFVRSAASLYKRLIISLSEGRYVLEDFLSFSLEFVEFLIELELALFLEACLE